MTFNNHQRTDYSPFFLSSSGKRAANHVNCRDSLPFCTDNRLAKLVNRIIILFGTHFRVSLEQSWSTSTGTITHRLSWVSTMDSYTDASPSQVEAVSEWSNASRDAGSVSQPHGTKPGPNRVAAELHQRMQDAGLSEPSKLFDSFDPTRSGTISFDDFATSKLYLPCRSQRMTRLLQP